MEKIISKQYEIQSHIEKYSKQLAALLNAEPVKYSEWYTHKKSDLSKAAGIYHFFERDGDTITSLYVGKAGFGSSSFGSSKWNLLKRLNQHFQVSQKNALLGKIAKATSKHPQRIKESLSKIDVFLQWLVLFEANSVNSEQIESELIWSECFCKSILMPKYTNA